MFMSFNQFRSVMKNERQVNMNVGSVNQLAFVGKTKTTKNGNEYEKSNKWLGIGIVATLADFGATQLWINKSKNPQIVEFMKDFASYSKTKRGIITAVEVASWFGIGLITDAIINKSRRKKADKASRA